MRAHDFIEAQTMPCEDTVLVYRIETKDGYGMYTGHGGPRHGNDSAINPCTSDDWEYTFLQRSGAWYDILRHHITVPMRHGFKSLMALYAWMNSDIENIRETCDEQDEGLFIRVYMLPKNACINLSRQTVFNSARVLNVADMDTELACTLIRCELQRNMENDVYAARNKEAA